MICLKGQIQKTHKRPFSPTQPNNWKTTPQNWDSNHSRENEPFKPCLALAQAFLTFPNQKKRKIDTRTQTLV
jgi:hypothetical protein